jgi:flagellar hook-basal body complex protein FliE
MEVAKPDLFEKIASTIPETRQPDSSAGGASFAKMLAEVNGLQHRADSEIKGVLLGGADPHEAMLALERAGLALKVLVQTRNKMIQAYEELSRMTM